MHLNVAYWPETVTVRGDRRGSIQGRSGRASGPIVRQLLTKADIGHLGLAQEFLISDLGASQTDV